MARNTSGLRPPFPKGNRANPGGRPKGAVDLAKKARAHTDKAIKALVDALENSASDETKIRAARELLDRAWGRPMAMPELEARKLAAEVAVLEHQVVEKQGGAGDKPATEQEIAEAGREKYGNELANAEADKTVH